MPATESPSKFKQVPANALRFNLGEFELGSNGDGAKTAPIKMVARTGKPIEHWYWGRVVHDLSGINHKPRIPVDYCHDIADVIGYLNKFDVTTGDLVVSGALVPYGDSDRASEVMFKAREGVPYEASINFGGDGILIEEIGEGQITQVNGYEFEGPGVVIRKWPLRGVAVCPYGADAGTSTEFSRDKDAGLRVEVTVLSNGTPNSPEKKMSDSDSTTPTAEAPQAVEAVTPNTPEKPAELGAPAAPGVEAGTVEPVATPAPSVEAPGKQFMDMFGEQQGAVYFARGLSMEDAMREHIKVQAQQIAELKATKPQAQTDRGLDAPVVFADGEPDASAPTKFASLIKIRGKK